MACTREVPEVETDCDGVELKEAACVSSFLHSEIMDTVTRMISVAGDYKYMQALEQSTQEEVRQCILEACEEV